MKSDILAAGESNRQDLSVSRQVAGLGQGANKLWEYLAVAASGP